MDENHDILKDSQGIDKQKLRYRKKVSTSK